ncbi:MAG: hypothetical protein EP329_02960 [Deltaproteobacteria bacterium]|nr:MAG: hypothetical protein EP329_02960 [Deltaproteobacteria bacterium]
MKEDIGVYIRGGAESPVLNIYLSPGLRNEFLASLADEDGRFQSAPGRQMVFQMALHPEMVTDPVLRAHLKTMDVSPHIEIPLAAIRLV